ncbi:Ubiquitinconjugating enzyme subfamily protein [Balamuthia mandrillaris]
MAEMGEERETVGNDEDDQKVVAACEDEKENQQPVPNEDVALFPSSEASGKAGEVRNGVAGATTSPLPETAATQSSSSAPQHFFSKYFREYTILIEYKHLPQFVPGGVFVLPSAQTLFEWHGVIFIRQGHYRKAVFKFILFIPSNYPESAPEVQFVSFVYHPAVSPSDGKLNVSPAFPNGWTPNKNHIWHVLAYIKKLFYQVDVQNVSNHEAAELFQNDATKFKAKVSECVQQSIDNVHINPDSSSLRFTEWNNRYHGPMRDHLLQKEDRDEEEGALAWLAKGVSKIINIKY